PEADPNYGEITGNIVLTAHGTPAVAPNGRIIGSKLGRKKPDEIVKMLTTSKDPKKRLAKAYDGTLTLCGCFTASGGPEGEKRDDPFAKKVLDIFRKRGYSKISVVGYPGATITDRGPGTDSRGTATEQGDERVLANQPTAATRQQARTLSAEAEKRITGFNALVAPYNAALAATNNARATVKKGITDSGLAEKDYLKTADGKAKLKAYQKADTAFKSLKAELNKAQAALDKAKKAMADSGLDDTYAQLEGRFGLRQVN
ncbi:MAG: hypothetical protein ACRDNS_30025, partial [Trebonia sp.]